MPNTLRSLLKQARDAVPGQRPIRLPWQEPTPGERAAAALDTVIEGEADLEERLSRSRDTVSDRGNELARRARERLSGAQSRLSNQLGGSRSDLSDRAARQVEQMQSGLGDQLDAAQSFISDRRQPKLPPVYERFADQAGEAAEYARSMAGPLAGVRERIQEGAGDVARQAGTAAKEGVQHMASSARERVQESSNRSEDEWRARAERGQPEGTEVYVEDRSGGTNRYGAPPMPYAWMPTGDGALAASAFEAADRASRSADRAEEASQRAEQVSKRTTNAASQVAAALFRLADAQRKGVAKAPAAAGPAIVEEGEPDEVEIRVDDTVESPLARAAEAIARAVASAGATVYDYSGGQYGLPPISAADLRRSRLKAVEQAGPVTVIEGSYAGKKKSRLPLLLAGAASLAGLGAVAYLQRDRIQEMLKSSRTTRTVMPRVRRGAVTPTPAYDRVVHGELIPGVRATTATPVTSPGTVVTAAGEPVAPAATQTATEADAGTVTQASGTAAPANGSMPTTPSTNLSDPDTYRATRIGGEPIPGEPGSF